MRHHVFGKKLNRDANHRKQMLKTMLSQLIVNGHMVTTATKAKVVTGALDKLITKAKNPSIAVRRQLLASLGNEKAVKQLMDVLAPHQAQITGGTVKMVRQGMRTGDGAMMVRLDLPIIEIAKSEDKKEAKETSKKAIKAKETTVKK